MFGLQLVVTKILNVVNSKKKNQQVGDRSELERGSVARYESKSKVSREISQQEFDKQVESYKERILVPREEAKQAKKEEEFQRFLGPAWKGKGIPLGGEDARSHQCEESQGHEAAELRHLPVTEVKNIPKPKKPKKKKMIVLPDEPDENDQDSVLVMLRTPTHTVHRRRFLKSATVQNVLDYMTTVGFSQIGYTLSTTYPRQNLSDQSEQTLSELGFHRQVVLNVEEKES